MNWLYFLGFILALFYAKDTDTTPDAPHTFKTYLIIGLIWPIITVLLLVSCFLPKEK